MGEHYYWRSGTGYEVNLSSWPFQVISEDGLGGPEVEMYSHIIPLQDGALYLGNRRMMRRFQIGIELMGHTRDEVIEARDALLAVLNTQWGLGAFGRDRNGVRREVYCLPVAPPRYQAGADEELGLRDVIDFQAPDFAFYDPLERAVAVTIGSDEDLVFPITFPIVFGSDSTAYVTATAYGDQPVYPIITLLGPLSKPVMRNITTGEWLTFTGNGGLYLTASQSAVIDCRPGEKTITRNDGTNLIPYLSTDSDLETFHLAPPPPTRFATLGEIPWQMGATQAVWAPNGVNELMLYGMEVFAKADPGALAAGSMVVKWHDRWGGI